MRGLSVRSAGGAANWGGSEHERGTAAFLAVHCLAGEPVVQFDLPEAEAVPQRLSLQADEPIDDIVCELAGGGRAFLQARRTLTFRNSRATGLRWVARQWIGQLEKGGIDPDRDRMIAVAHRLSPAVEDLKDALELLGAKRPRSELSSKQREALAALEQMLAALSKTKRKRLLSCARIWVLRVSDQRDTAQSQCQQLLSANVVADGRGAAWNRLLNVCAVGARLRLGYDREQLYDELRRESIPLLGDEPGSGGARRAAMVRYRDRIQRRGERLDFAGLGGTVPPISLERGDAEVKVSPGGPKGVEDDRWGDDLTWALRRRGRVLLTGLPGAGKTTALEAAAAAYAKRPEWPVPIVVRADRLAQRSKAVGIREAIVELAVELASGTDRRVLAEQLDQELSDSGVALFLDALDETRSARHEVLRELKAFIDDLDPDVEVLLATRDLAYVDATSLGFSELRLLAPREPAETAEAVLEALAEKLGVEDPESWVSRRVRWVKKWLGQDKALQETPLLVVLLSMFAASHGEEALPSSKAAVMVEVLKAVIDQWETANGRGGRIGKFQGRLARAALIESFLALSQVLAQFELPSVERCRTAVAARLGAEFDITAVESEACAADAVAFWDEAGFFVLTAEQEVLPRLRLFAEVGEAWRASKLSDRETRDWIRAALPDPDRTETLRLAAQLSGRIRHGLVAEAAAAGDAEQVVIAADVADTAPPLAPASRNSLAKALIAVLAGDSFQQPAAEALTKLELSARLRGEARRAYESAALPNAIAFEALLALGAKRPSAAEQRAIRAVIDTDAPERERGSGPLSALLVFQGDPIWSRAVVGALERLLPDDPALGARALELVDQVGVAPSGRLEELIRLHAGSEVRAALASKLREGAAALPRRGSDWLEELENRHAANREFLRWLTDVGAQVELKQGQRRRFDDLVDLWRTLDLPTAPVFEPSGVLEEHPELLRECFLALAALSDGDLSLIASEARAMLDEMESFPDDADDLESLLNMGGRDGTFKAWNRLDDQVAARRVLSRALAIGRWLSWLAVRALAESKLTQEELDTLRRRLPQLRASRRVNAGLLVLLFEGADQAEAWLDGEDALLGRASAWWSAGTFDGKEHLGLVERVLANPDDGVRATFLKHLPEPAPSEICPVIQAADLSPRPWLCVRCGHHNSRGRDDCESCHVVEGDVRRSAERVLEQCST